MRSISSPSASILSLNSVSFDCFASRGTQFIERLLNREFVDLSHDCCLPRRRKAKSDLPQRTIAGKSFRLDVSLLAAPRRAGLWRDDLGTENKIPSITMVAENGRIVDLGQASSRSSSKAFLGCGSLRALHCWTRTHERRKRPCFEMPLAATGSSRSRVLFWIQDSHPGLDCDSSLEWTDFVFD